MTHCNERLKSDMEASNACLCGLDVVENLKTTSLTYEENVWSDNLLIQLDLFRQTDMLCDVTVLVDDTEFRCHRIILAAACPYFQALFHHDLDSRVKSELCLRGITAVGFQSILNFMYTSKILITTETVIDILEAADFLQYRGIVRACCDVLLQNITDENVISLHQLAVAHLCQPLVEATGEHIRSNFYHVAQTNDFLCLSPAMMSEFVSTYRNFEPPSVTEQLIVQKSLCAWASQFDEHFLADLKFDALETFIADLETSVSKDCRENVISNSRIVQKTVIDSFKAFFRRLKTVEVLIVMPGEASGKAETATANKKSTRNIYYYNPADERWLILTELPFYNRTFYSVTSLDNHLYVCGGEKKYDMPTRRVHAYVVDDNRWLMQVESMLKPRSNHSAASAGGLLYVVGGRGSSDNDLWDNGEVYNPKVGQWTLLPSLPGVIGLARCSLVPLGGQLYLFGGMESFLSKEAKERRVFRGAYRFHIETQHWSYYSALAVQLDEHKISVGVGDSFAWKGFILIIDEDRRGKKMKLFNPLTGVMSDFLNSNGQHRFGGYALLNDVLYCTGGMVEHFECHDLVHRSDLLGNCNWEFVTPLPCQLSHHTCTLVSKVIHEKCE